MSYLPFIVIIIVSLGIISLAVWQMFKDANEQEKKAKTYESEARFKAYEEMQQAYHEKQNVEFPIELPPTEAEVWNHAIDAVLDKLQSNWWTIEDIRSMKR